MTAQSPRTPPPLPAMVSNMFARFAKPRSPATNMFSTLQRPYQATAELSMLCETTCEGMLALLSAAAYVKPLSVLGCLSFSICLIHVVRSVVMFSLPLLLPSVMSYVPSLTNLTRWRGEQHNKRGTLMQAFLCLLREWHCAKHDVR